MLAFVLVFLRKFDDLSAIPVAYTSMIIVILAGGPGKTVGACVQGVFLGLSGVVLGSGFFAILAKLANFPVAQAVVFAVIVYCESSIPILSPYHRNLATGADPQSTWGIVGLWIAIYPQLEVVHRLNTDDVICLI